MARWGNVVFHNRFLLRYIQSDGNLRLIILFCVIIQLLLLFYIFSLPSAWMRTLIPVRKYEHLSLWCTWLYSLWRCVALWVSLLDVLISHFVYHVFAEFCTCIPQRAQERRHTVWCNKRRHMMLDLNLKKLADCLSHFNKNIMSFQFCLSSIVPIN